MDIDDFLQPEKPVSILLAFKKKVEMLTPVLQEGKPSESVMKELDALSGDDFVKTPYIAKDS